MLSGNLWSFYVGLYVLTCVLFQYKDTFLGIPQHIRKTDIIKEFEHCGIINGRIKSQVMPIHEHLCKILNEEKNINCS